ncbi:MAG: hypothetical protein ACOX7K_08110 [Oscillospiraceae bacterium]|jgi:hypothetical protein
MEENNVVMDGQDASSVEEVEKTFTQDDVDRIVRDRLARERERINGMINEDERIRMELAASRMKLDAAATLSKQGYPHELLDLLDYSNTDACQKSLDKVCSVFDTAVKLEIDRIFRANGRVPSIGTTTLSSNDKLRDAFRPD